MTASVTDTLLRSFNPTLVLVLNLCGTFVFGISGGLAAVRARLDPFGVLVLAAVVGLAGGIARDVLIGRPPATFRDWRYLAVVGAAGVVTWIAAPALHRMQPTIDVLDAAGLSLFSVTGASIALTYGLGPSEAIVLGAISGIGGGILRDLIVREIPQVLRSGLYAIPAIIGATIVVIAQRAGAHGVIFPLVGAMACFAVRVAAIRYDLNLPPRTE
ncbi:MAG TPA: trimeric intracellular cation channel family protein [Solirubrobacteraceae bacterium]|nr:trimeric intracellular cation channel family protein [Solirubrobacteraceae bacterium]